MMKNNSSMMSVYNKYIGILLKIILHTTQKNKYNFKIQYKKLLVRKKYDKQYIPVIYFTCNLKKILLLSLSLNLHGYKSEYCN